jgi:UDP-N-acetylglucosamine 2-epimerase (non-hydrolysing)
MTHRIAVVFGTRPEAIKMAPVILTLRHAEWAEVKVLATAQHREMLDQVLSVFEIVPDADLDLMEPDQSLSELSARMLLALDRHLADPAPHMVLAQGDTTTVLMTALACFYRRIPFGHVEAGLRTHDLDNPFPEEMNRVQADRMACLHFAPTPRARDNLLLEGYGAETVHVTGNTVIDALLATADKDIPLGVQLNPDQRLILMTSHRRENFGPPFRAICGAVRDIVERNQDVQVLYPVHPNPHVSDTAREVLGDHPRILLTEPLDYGPFITAMKRADIILTDSGGVQEEAPSLGKPVLVLRDETERPEAVEAGVARLVGRDRKGIVETAQLLLDNPNFYREMAVGASPYGDGKASARIRDLLQAFLGEKIGADPRIPAAPAAGREP